MQIREAELQMVTYNSDKIAHTAARVVTDFAHYSAIPGTENWIQALPAIINICQDQVDTSCTLKTDGLIVQFSGFPTPIPRIGEHGVVYAARAPRITIQPQEKELLPTVRTHLERFTNSLADEMEEVYRLDVRDNGGVLIFPKRHYAEEITVVKVSLLG